jgi:DUF4097 and DUF4098 domain-containing protein YvlB
MSSRLPIVSLSVFVLCWGLLAAPALAETRIERQFDLAPGGRLFVDTEAGSVSVTGGSGSGCRVVITSSREDLDEKIDFSFEPSPGELRIVGKRKGMSWFGNWSFKGKLLIAIEVPERTEVDLDTAGGALEVDSLDGDVRLDTSGGAIRVSQVRGAVLADTSGGAITVREVEGDVNADTSGGGIHIEDVDGAVRADTSGGGIKIIDVTGDLVADTSGGSIEISGAEGRVEADTSGGPIDVAFAPGNSRGGSLSTSGGEVRVVLDAGADLELDAETSGGTVRSDLPVKIQGAVDKHSLKGTLGGGGATLKLRASGGGIRIEEG